MWKPYHQKKFHTYLLLIENSLALSKGSTVKPITHYLLSTNTARWKALIHCLKLWNFLQKSHSRITWQNSDTLKISTKLVPSKSTQTTSSIFFDWTKKPKRLLSPCFTNLLSNLLNFITPVLKGLRNFYGGLILWLTSTNLEVTIVKRKADVWRSLMEKRMKGLYFSSVQLWLYLI